VIISQVEAGVHVRMAVLYELAADAAGGSAELPAEEHEAAEVLR
jgi:hypothetical protein